MAGYVKRVTDYFSMSDSEWEKIPPETRRKLLTGAIVMLGLEGDKSHVLILRGKRHLTFVYAGVCVLRGLTFYARSLMPQFDDVDPPQDEDIDELKEKLEAVL